MALKIIKTKTLKTIYNTHKKELSMNELKNVKFLPWVGENYNSQEVKIFIIGESFINNGKSETVESRNNDENITIKIIEEVKSGKTKAKHPKKEGEFRRHNDVFRLYNNIFRMLYNKSKAEPLLKHWDDYAFANFFQSYLGDKNKGSSHSKVKNDDISSAQKALPEYLEYLNPSLAIVCGISDMQNIWFPCKESRLKLSAANNFYLYTINGRKYNIWFIPHPSSKEFQKADTRGRLHKEYKEILEKLPLSILKICLVKSSSKNQPKNL